MKKLTVDIKRECSWHPGWLQNFKKLRQADEENQLENLQQENHEDNSVREGGDGDIQIEKLSVPKIKKRKRNESMQDLMDKYRITPVRKGLSERKKKWVRMNWNLFLLFSTRKSNV